MTNIRLVADSTCDLSDELISQYDITIIPLCIIMDDKSYYDKEEITPQEIFQWADANRTTPKTSAVSYERALQVLKPFMDAGDDIIFMGISMDMSTTCNVIRLIGEDCAYPNLHVIDSMNLSTGIGLQLLYAAKLIAEGKSTAEIVTLIEARRSKVRSSFVVDTLTYLARGGRCSAATALLANTLRLKPEIVVENGAMGVHKKFRGKQDSVLQKYVQELESALLQADPACVFVTHAACGDALIDKIMTYLQGLNHFDAIHVTTAGGVISSHCGPGTLGVLFYAE